MPRVVILERAFSDPRFELLAQELREPRRTAQDVAWRIAALWSHAVGLGGRTVSVEAAAVVMACKPDRVGQAITRARLGHVVGDGADVELHVGDLFALAEDDDAVTERASVPEAVIALLESGPMTRAELRRRLGCRNEAVSSAVAELLQSGRIQHGRNGLSIVPGTFPGTMAPFPTRSRERSGNVPGGEGGALSPDLRDLSDLTEDLRSEERERALPSVPERSRAERSRNVPGTFPGTMLGTDSELLAVTTPLERGPTRERTARLLWDRQEQIRRELVPTCQPVPFEKPIFNGPKNRLEVLLASFAPADLVRVLEVYKAEAEVLAERGDDPLRWLNGVTNWRDEGVQRALAAAPEDMAKRGRSGRRARGTESVPVPAEIVYSAITAAVKGKSA